MFSEIEDFLSILPIPNKLWLHLRLLFCTITCDEIYKKKVRIKAEDALSGKKISKPPQIESRYGYGSVWWLAEQGGFQNIVF
jgi:hypothetical protein